MSSIRHTLVRLAAAAVALVALSVTAQQSNTIVLNPPQPTSGDGKIEVLEFFAYGCIHCASLEPSLEEWAKKQPADVKIIRVPHPTAIRGIDSRPLYYGLAALGQVDRLHGKIFVAVNNDNVNLAVPSVRDKWLKANGVDPAKFEEVVKSFTVQNQVRRAQQMAADYRIEGTPMMAVNGRTSVSSLGGFPRMFATVEQLIAEARAANAAANPTASKSAPAKSSAKEATPTPRKEPTKTAPAPTK